MRLPPLELLIFDLDGTLIDSKEDLANAVNAARGHMGMPPLENELVYSYVGNGAPVLMRRAVGPEASEEDEQKALEFFLEYYRDHMLDHTVLYPGVRESIDRLFEAGLKLAVLTNKPVRFSQLLVDGLGLGGHFQRVYGGNSFEQKKPHPAGVEKLLAECNVDRSRAMMVGDSDVDIRTARNAGIRACGVTYGLQPETLAEVPPDILVDRMEEMVDMVLTAREGTGEVKK
jgi:phosphoglycolate phosphatase